MSVSCGLECVVCFGCTRWAWKRLTYIGAYDSETWPAATPEEFEPIPRICRVILAVYEDDLSRPRFPPPGGYRRMDPTCVVKRATYDDTGPNCPPYLLYLDRPHRQLILAIRGLNLARESDYKVLLDNRLELLDGGYVHRGLLKAAVWILDRESDALRRQLHDLGPDHTLVFAGHSLGSGIAALMALLVVANPAQFGGIPRSRVRCYAIAPARCMSLNLAVKYADVVNSVVLQDDFLPRTPTPLEHIFGSIFCLPCLLFFVCMRDTFIPEKKKLSDPKRLYAPGRMYHIVERKFCRCGRYPPEVRTAIPVEGRFEHIVLSCNATSDHGIVWIEREAEKALELMKEIAKATTPPPYQKMERKESLEQEHRSALERADTLNIPHVVPPSQESLDAAGTSSGTAAAESQTETTPTSKSSGRTNWDELVEKLFIRSDSGRSLVLKRDIIIE
ncbi:uncharacterized protein LOC109711247 [Ananas comosus]|uniref:Uncharacterized protein LOC109711247 n=1 Tax=Ananas comosus TaxID=4615 RepID=A0A6P5F921_ANACO|nr:uncharacterized protein LOC109711247 [Ananas comosus]